MTKGNETSYSAIDIVRQVHSLPHLNLELEQQSNDFDITYDDYNNSYTQSLVTLPVLIGGLALFLLFAFQVYLLFASCCACCPQRNALGESVRGKKTIRTRLALAVVIIGVFIVNQIVLFGNAELSRGVDHLKDGLDYLESTFKKLDDDGNKLLSYGDDLSAQWTNASLTGCAAAAQLVPYIDEYDSYVNDYLDVVSPVSDQCSDISDDAHDWAVGYKDDSIWILYAIIMVNAIVFSCGLLLQSGLLIGIGNVLAISVLLVYFILCTVEMIILVGDPPLLCIIGIPFVYL